MKNLIFICMISIFAAGLFIILGCKSEQKFTLGPAPAGTLFDDFGQVIAANQYGLDGTWFSMSEQISNPCGYFSDSPGYDDTGYALHLTASATCTSYGVLLMSALNSALYVSPNMQDRTGIRFYAKDTGNKSYKFVLQSAMTTMSNYEYTFTVNSSWMQINIPFYQLTQPHQDETTMSTALQEVTHFVWKNGTCPETIDLWLDHIEVY